MGILLTQAAGIAVCLLVVSNAVAAVDAISGRKTTPKKQTDLKEESSLTVPKFEGDRQEAGKRAISKKRMTLRSTDSNGLRLLVKRRVEKRRVSRSVANQQGSETPHSPKTYVKRVFLRYLPRQRKLHNELKSAYGVQTILGKAPRWRREHAASRTNEDKNDFSQRRSFSKKRDLKPACFPFCFPHYGGKREMFSKYYISSQERQKKKISKTISFGVVRITRYIYYIHLVNHVSLRREFRAVWILNFAATHPVHWICLPLYI